MNKSASLTPLQGPSTVVCMILTELSQLPHWLHQLPTVGKGRWQAPYCKLSFCCNSRSNGKQTVLMSFYLRNKYTLVFHTTTYIQVCSITRGIHA
jgi:hypothetical protein